MAAKIIVFRVDGGEQIGFGHVVRSVALAKYLEEKFEVKALFYSKYNEVLKRYFIEKKISYSLDSANTAEEDLLRGICEANKDCTIFIDKLYNYHSSIIQECQFRGNKVILFHDICDGMDSADLVIFPIAHLDPLIIDKYTRTPATPQTRFIHGFDYVIINDEAKKHADLRSATISPTKTVVLTTGASDPENILITLVQWINDSDIEIPFKALYGFDLQAKQQLLSLKSSLKETIELKEFNYDDLFNASLAVSAFGVTPYELIYAQVPVITIGHTSKSAEGSDRLAANFKASISLGNFSKLNKETFLSTVRQVYSSDLADFANRQKGLIDGWGLERIANLIYNL